MADFYAQVVNDGQECGFRFRDELPEEDGLVFHGFKSRDEILAYLKIEGALFKTPETDDEAGHLVKTDDRFEWPIPDEYDQAINYYEESAEFDED